MEFKITPATKNHHPRKGVLIKSSSPREWLTQIQGMSLVLEDIAVFPVPGSRANELYGCVVSIVTPEMVKNLSNNQFLQLVNEKIFIPDYSNITPLLSDSEWKKNFDSCFYIFHPDIGLVELKVPVSWEEVLALPPQTFPKLTIPMKPVYIPQKISTLFIDADIEKIAAGVEKPFGQAPTEKPPFDMEKLLKGNKKELQKYMDLLKSNPELALQYAVPLDLIGSTRGGNKGRFSFGKFGKGKGKGIEIPSALKVLIVVVGIALLIAFANSKDSESMIFKLGLVVFVLIRLFSYLNDPNQGAASSGGSAAIDTETFDTLHQQYEQMAKEFIAQGHYQKAAHIYLKLLKNNHKAAKVLEEGKCFAEAAIVYLKYCQNKQKAAECYEQGKIYIEAIALYKEMQQNEKVGDLYSLMNHRSEADQYYVTVAENYKLHHQYVKAALIYRNKMGNPVLGQAILMEGWNSNKDAYNCLNNYFVNIDEIEALKTEIWRIYNETTDINKESFLQVVKHEYAKYNELKAPIKEIAYEIISDKIDKNPEIASEIIFFNRQDNAINKDVMKYKSKNRGIRL